MVKLIDAMILWNKYRAPHSDGTPKRLALVKVIDHPRQTPQEMADWIHLDASVGCCFKNWPTLTDVERAGYIMALFNQITVEDKIPMEKVHEAFLEIDEYAEFHAENANAARWDNPFWRLCYGAL